ncbi:MAG: glycosyltransferase family 2 protein [Dehalococcoidia bacterium]|nr:glycosyltransferase family 2 protein [Dehalococcoidia bacterium]
MAERGVSVIIPVKDDPRLLACLTSVLALEGEAPSLQVIVVDNGSPPAFRASLAALPPGVIVADEARPGAYAARNRALPLATGDVLFFTDADCLVQKGWIARALGHLARGADIVQGFSGSSGTSRVDRLVQVRYQAHLRRLRHGAPTECDTRNLAVRAAVFNGLRFNDRYRRVGDTELGLLAELAGAKVAYCPAMRVDHAHERDLRLFLAKQVCHGWGAQRLMHERPQVRWHGGHLRLVARVSATARRLPYQRRLAAALAAIAIRLGGRLEARAESLPLVVGASALGALDKLAALSGHLLFEAGQPEPSPSGLLGRHHPRD